MNAVQEPLVRLSGICKTFGRKTALDNAELTLNQGEVLALIGDNGAGKSTLLKVLCGVTAMDAGTLTIQGKTCRLPSPHHSRRMGIEMVFQDLSLCKRMTVWENIYIGRYQCRRLAGIPLPLLDKQAMRQGAARILAELGISLDSLDSPVTALSGGEQQAVAIGRCLLFEPKIILMDEPTASMALWEKNNILKMVAAVREQGRSVIMVTHDIPEVFHVADRVMVLKEGRNIWDGPLDGLSPEDLAQMMFVGKRRMKTGSLPEAP